MIYVYPRLSSRDYYLFRCGGAGLGNILFTYARAIVYAKRNRNIKVIWPTWVSLKIGPILRGEKDKRFYSDLFDNNSGYIDGVRKVYILTTKQHFSENEAKKIEVPDDCVVDFTGFEGCFKEIIDDSQFVYSNIVANLKPRNRKALEFKAKKSICMHVRLGDFSRVSWREVKSGRHCSAIPIEWYVKMGKELRKIIGYDVKIYIFSDGTDQELAPLLNLENTERIFCGSAISDIIALSKAGILVASGSSFSMWARYLGRMTTVMFPNQVKQEILQPYDQGREIVALDKFSLNDIEFIKEYWKKISDI